MLPPFELVLPPRAWRTGSRSWPAAAGSGWPTFDAERHRQHAELIVGDIRSRPWSRKLAETGRGIFGEDMMMIARGARSVAVEDAGDCLSESGHCSRPAGGGPGSGPRAATAGGQGVDAKLLAVAGAAGSRRGRLAGDSFRIRFLCLPRRRPG